MARSLRIEFEGALYHVINRGIARKTIFHGDKDWTRFLDFQERVMTQFNWICHAYCLMGNHYHLLVETPDPNLSRGMKLLNQLYSQFYNFKYQRCGPVFQGRYKAWLVDKEQQYLENCRYIVNNPVKSDLVQHPSQWIWSSFNATCGKVKAPPYLATDLILKHFTSSRKRAHQIYEAFILAADLDDSPFNEIRNQIFLGSETFVRETLLHVSERERSRSLAKEQRMAGRPALEDLFNKKTLRSNMTRNKKIKAAFEAHQYTLKEIGDHLGLNPDYLSRLLCDMRKR